MNNFWGIDAQGDPVVERMTYEKNVGTFYGVRENEGPSQQAPDPQTKDTAIRAFFNVTEKEPGTTPSLPYSEAGNATARVWGHKS